MLTAKQEHFARLVTSGMTQTQAYQEAYSTGGMKPETVWTEASKLAKNPAVVERMNTLRAEIDETKRVLLVNREEAILRQLENEAFSARTDSARVKALELLGKHLGLFTDKVVVSEKPRSEDEIEASILERLERYGVSVNGLNRLQS